VLLPAGIRHRTDLALGDWSSRFGVAFGRARGGDLCGRTDGEVGTQLLQAPCANALHVLEIVDRLERTMSFAVVDDRLRLGGSEALVESDELFLRRGVDVDEAEAWQRRERERHSKRCEQALHDLPPRVVEEPASSRAGMEPTKTASDVRPRYGEEAPSEIRLST